MFSQKSGSVLPGRLAQSFTAASLAVVMLLAITGCAAKNTPKVGSDGFDLADGKVGTLSLYPADTKAAASYEMVAGSSEGLSLWIDGNHAAIRLRNGDKVWDSVPAQAQRDEAANNAAKMAMSSLILVTYTDKTGNETTINGYAAVKKGNFSLKKLENGVRFDFLFEREGFVIPVIFALTDDGFAARLRMDQVEERNADYRLVSVSLLPYFGAVRTTDPAPDDGQSTNAGAGKEMPATAETCADRAADGFLLLPDGAGALVQFSKAPVNAGEYQRYFYGREPVDVSLEGGTPVQETLLPVFGLNRGEDGYVAVVTRGAAKGLLHARGAGNKTSYFTVWPEFIYRDSTSVLVEKKNQTVKMYEQAPTPAVKQVEYHLLAGEAATLAGMANSVQQALKQNEAAIQTDSKTDTGQTTPGFDSRSVITLIGGGVATVNVAGFPTRQVIGFTTFAQAKDLLHKLQTNGARGMAVRYRYWQKKADDSGILTDFVPEGKLGGAKEFADLASWCDRQKIALCPSVDFTNLADSTWRYHRFSHAAKSVSGNAAMQYTYRLSDQRADRLNPTYLLAPAQIGGAVTAFMQKLATFEKTRSVFVGLCDESLGRQIYSSFSDDGSADRDENIIIWQQALQQLSSNGLMVQAGCDYALASADLIVNAPMGASGDTLETVSVPFYQMVLSGWKQTASTPLNELANEQDGLLLCASVGMLPHYQLLAGEADRLQDTTLSSIVSGAAADWEQRAAAGCKRLGPLLDKVSGQQITGYEMLSAGVTKTTWADGTAVIVNRSGADDQTTGQTVEAGSFLLLTAAQEKSGEGVTGA